MFVTLVAFQACSNRGEIEGKVLNALDGSPLADTTVSVTGTTTTAITDSAGRYVLEEVIPGPQQVAAEKDGYMALGVLSLTTAAGEVTNAADLMLLPRPQAPGLYVANGATLDPLIFKGEQDINRYLNQLADRNQTQVLPMVQATSEFLFWPGDGAPPAIEYAFMELLYKRAELNWILNIPAHYELSKLKGTISQKDLGAGVLKLEAELAPGKYAMMRKHPLGVADWYYFFEVVLPAAEAVLLPDGKGRGLRVNDGSYNVRSQQWAMAKDIVIEWCSAQKDTPACPSVTKEFLEVRTSGNNNCLGTLIVKEATAILSSWSCGGGSSASLKREGDVFRVDRVWEDETTGD